MGLHYNRFRYYDPNSGRFSTQDPIGLYGGTNIYRYAPSPTGRIDPLGLDNASDAQALAANLTACGQGRPNERHRAHHIVMSNSTDPKMQQLRDKMQSLGLDINDASNGIWLPELGNDRLPGSTLTAHKGEGVHGQGYVNSVHETLIGAQNREEFMAGLESIKSRLCVGTTFPLGCCCRLKEKP